MTLRTEVIVVLLALAAATLIAVWTFSPREPTYHSQPLSYWIEINRSLDRFGRVPVPDGRTPPWYRDLIEQQQHHLNEARAAITTIGTNGLPYLTRWMRYEPPLWGTRLIPWGPRRLRNQLDHRMFSTQDRADRAEAAIQALELLGTNAVPVIPALTALAMKTNAPNPHMAGAGLRILSHLGPEALPAMINVWSNAAPRQKQNLSLVIGDYFLTINTRDQLPSLISAMQTQAEPLRSAAQAAISRIAPELLTNTPSQ